MLYRTRLTNRYGADLAGVSKKGLGQVQGHADRQSRRRRRTKSSHARPLDFWGNFKDSWPGPSWNASMIMTALGAIGPNGTEGTVRLEALREGVQETEARIALEKALDGGKGKTPEGDKAWTMLDARILDTGFIPSNWTSNLSEHCVGWQERSRALYEAAARLAK